MIEKKSNSIQWVAGAIIVASVIISGTIIYTNSDKGSLGQNNNNQPGTGNQPAVVDASKVNIANSPYIGNENAKLLVVEWFDYQCPFCKRIHDEVITQLIKDYVDTGKVKIVFKDYAFLGADSTTAALVARAVWEAYPDKFYQWHSAMYDNQDEEHGGWGNKTDILALAKSLGMDSNKLDQLMTSKATEYQKIIDADKAEGTSLGINGTPGTIIGKQLISGAQPYATFKAAIDSQLK